MVHIMITCLVSYREWFLFLDDTYYSVYHQAVQDSHENVLSMVEGLRHYEQHPLRIQQEEEEGWGVDAYNNHSKLY